MSPRRTAVALCALLALGLVPATLQGQTVTRREGVSLGFGVGSGWARVSCDICTADRGGGLAGHFQLGVPFGSRLVIGAEANGWRGGLEEDVDEFLGSISALAYWYTSPRGGLHLKGGFAVLAYRLDDDVDALTGTALGPHVGIGYEIPLGRYLSLAPYFNAMVAPLGGNLNFNGGDVTDDTSFTLLQWGVALIRH